MTIKMMSQSLRQVATYTVPPNVSLRIFEEQSSTSSIPRLLIAEPLLDWQRDDQGRPLINAVSRVQGGGAVFELRLIISTVESQQAAQRAVSTNPSLQNMCLITQIDSVNLALAKGNMGESLEFCGGEMYPSRNSNSIAVKFESSSLTASERDVGGVRSILRSVRLTCKASVNGHELPPISLDFSKCAPPPCIASPSSGPTTLNDAIAGGENRVNQPRRAPHPPLSVSGSSFGLGLGNLVAATGRPLFIVLSFFLLLSILYYAKYEGSGNVHELPLLQSTVISSPSLDPTTLNDVVALQKKPAYREFRAPHSPRSVSLPFGTIYQLVWTPSGNLVAATNGPSFYILKSDGEVIRQITSGTVSQGLENTWGVAVSDDGHIFVSDYHTHRIIVYTESGEYIRSLRELGNGTAPFENPSSMAISKKTGNLFVADYSNHRVQVFNQEGKFLYLFGNPYLSFPHGIDIDDDDTVYVAENLGHKISVFTSNGQFLRSFGSYGSAPGQFNGLHQLYIDRPSDRILVAEWGNRRIQIMNKFGAVEQVIQTGFPTSAVVTDKDGKLIVGGHRVILLYDN